MNALSGTDSPLSQAQEADFPAIPRWWPRLSIRHKNEIENDLNAQLSESTIEEIEHLLSVTLTRKPHFLSQHDRDFIVTQGEPVD